MRFLDVQFGAAANVFRFRFGAQQAVALVLLSFRQLGFQFGDTRIAQIDAFRRFRQRILVMSVLFHFFRDLLVWRLLFFTTHEYLRVLALISQLGLLWGSKPGFQVNRSQCGA